jgi:hypothetical protein
MTQSFLLSLERVTQHQQPIHHYFYFILQWVPHIRWDFASMFSSIHFSFQVIVCSWYNGKTAAAAETA